jgi:hypothetical protein
MYASSSSVIMGVIFSFSNEFVRAISRHHLFSVFHLKASSQQQKRLPPPPAAYSAAASTTTTTTNKQTNSSNERTILLSRDQ